MKKNKILFAIVLIFIVASCSKSEQEDKEVKPNIVLFLVDDMGWQDTSVPFWNQKTPFNKTYHTPNMERLAKEGMKFTQAYASAVCSPTRISLMTGMNAARHRVTNWTLKKDMIQPMEQNHPTLEFPRWNVNGLSQTQGINNTVYATPLPQLLKDAGYFTIHSGKAHLGAIGTPGANPINLGFDVNIAGHAAGAPESYFGKENFGNGKEGKEIWAVPGLEQYHGKDVFLTEALTLEALKALDTSLSKNKPFFLYMSHYAVHAPIMGDPRFLQKYLNKGMDTVEAKYATLIEGIDKSLGDIMNYLDDKNLTDNTIILFMSDNGGLSAVARGGEPHTHNAPLTSGKGSAYEGGIREPMIVKWPEIIKPNSVSDDYLIIEDFYPTILNMAGIENPKIVQTIDGQSFIPSLQGKRAGAERAIYWHYPNNWGATGPGIGASSSIRKGDWKLIYFHENRKIELFNLANDIGEQDDLLESNPEKAIELASQLSQHLINVDAQMTIDKATNKQVAYPINVLNYDEN